MVVTAINPQNLLYLAMYGFNGGHKPSGCTKRKKNLSQRFTYDPLEDFIEKFSYEFS